jgi:hypothetical protein
MFHLFSGSTGDLYSHTISLTSTTVNSHRLCSMKNIQKNVAMVILNSTHIALSGIQQDNHSKSLYTNKLIIQCILYNLLTSLGDVMALNDNFDKLIVKKKSSCIVFFTFMTHLKQ